jgi:hypothetical protein
MDPHPFAAELHPPMRRAAPAHGAGRARLMLVLAALLAAALAVSMQLATPPAGSTAYHSA